MMKLKMSYIRNVNVYETDLMGIVHHSNYLRYCEEARVNWCKSKGLLSTDDRAVFSLAVLETRVKHIKPARYGDAISIDLQIKRDGAKLIFQYKLSVQNQIISIVETIHCNLDLNLRVKKLSPELIQLTEKELWTETWL